MVVTNSGPLMALGKLNYLILLAQLYKKVFMPNAVYNEVVERGFAQGKGYVRSHSFGIS